MISVIIVAGGRSTRLGADKRRLRVWGDDGPTLLEHTVAIARSLSDDVLVVLNDAAAWAQLEARFVPDSWPNAGPLGGIASGLRAAQHEWSLVLAADLPLLDITMLRELLAMPRYAQAIVPLVGDEVPRYEPLHALYHRACLPIIESHLAADQRKIAALLAVLQVQPFPISGDDPRARSFTNLNTPADVSALSILYRFTDHRSLITVIQRNSMRRIAYCSPVNPVESGISDYSEELLPYLGQYFDITLIIDDGVQPTNPQLAAHLPIERISRLAKAHRRQPFDAIIYHMGNSPAHSAFWAALQTLPGVVVLHDYVLHHLMLWHAVNRRKDVRLYRAEMTQRYGAEGERVATLMERGQLNDAVFDLPLSESVIERATGLIAHSRYVVDRALAVRPNLRAAVVPMGVPSVAVPDRALARRELGLPAAAPIWASFGHINPYKRIEQALRAFTRFRAEHADARFVLVGSVSPNYDLRGLVARLRLQDAVQITGYVNSADFGRYVAAADLCFNGRYPSAGETSASLLRLLGAGRAVLVSDVATFSELPPAVVAHVPLDDDEERTILAYAERLWADAALRHTLEANARAYVAREHTLGGAAAGYAGFLSELYRWEQPKIVRPPLWEVEGSGIGDRGSGIGDQENGDQGSGIRDRESPVSHTDLSIIGERVAELGLNEADVALLDRAAARLHTLL